MKDVWPDWIKNDIPRLVSVDVETAGPNPADYSLLSIGACTLAAPRRDFYIELQPTSMKYTDEAMAIHSLDFDELAKTGKKASQAMKLFADWLLESVPPGRRPLFLGFNAPFDWMFIGDYFHHYLGRNPFGHSALDVKSFYMGFGQIEWAETSMKKITNIELRHNALEDACDQATLFKKIVSGKV
jgi:ribonuclease T